MKSKLLSLCALTFLAAAIPISSIQAGESRTPKKPAANDTDAVEFFAAIEAKQIEVKVFPADSKRMTILVENKTKRPLTIQVPDTIAAVPVLAQIGAFPPLGGQNNNNQGGNQAVGGPFGGNNNLFGGNNGNNNRGGNNMFRGLFNIPPGKVIKKKLDCVCLEHGKPDPNPRIPYEIKPLESVTKNAGVRELLLLFGQGKHDQRIVQLAAWHLANGISWQELAKIEYKRADSRRVPQYSASELARAKKLVEKLPKQKTPQPSDSSPSLSQR